MNEADVRTRSFMFVNPAMFKYPERHASLTLIELEQFVEEARDAGYNDDDWLDRVYDYDGIQSDRLIFRRDRLIFRRVAQ